MSILKKYIHNAFFTHSSFIARRLPNIVAGVPIHPSNVPPVCNVPNAIFTNPKLFNHKIECNCTSTCKYNEKYISLWELSEKQGKRKNKNIDSVTIEVKPDPSYPPLL